MSGWNIPISELGHPTNHCRNSDFLNLLAMAINSRRARPGGEDEPASFARCRGRAA